MKKYDFFIAGRARNKENILKICDLFDKYKTNNLNVNGRSITYHLKQRGYPKTRKYRCGGYTFYTKK